jgi:hypothetical protein
VLALCTQVLTPVRRSARMAPAELLQGPAAVEPMLEATNFCYMGAEAAQHGGGKGDAVAASDAAAVKPGVRKQ